MSECSRFAPSTTGPAHPGTLLAGLLCWLDARRRGGRVVLRLEDLDHTRSKPGFPAAMEEALAWFGLDWDEVHVQSEYRARHAAALDALAAAGRLYPCHCSRKQRRAGGRRSPDGGIAYDNVCRDRALPAGGWREAGAPLRVRLDDDRVVVVDEGGLDLTQRPAHELGDPIVVRRDGVVAYHLVVVVDDAATGVTRVVRGRDLAASTATQVALQRLLTVPVPVYRHHFLLLEPHGDKLAKLHGAVGVDQLRHRYRPDELCGLLAHAAGLLPQPRPCRPDALVADFDWARVRVADRVMAWQGGALVLDPEDLPAPANSAESAAPVAAPANPANNGD
ncbi:glutamate--tRNA ligase family protein [Haliangium sp.]|uniref:glutamate--tRNA ligase family protein n=1 Tax=Haliangium sp. TaxID=2663208 RepID=UPI003D132147